MSFFLCISADVEADQMLAEPSIEFNVLLVQKQEDQIEARYQARF